MATRRRGAVGLGRNQKLVLMLLADGSKTAIDMECDRVPGLDEGAIRSAIAGLERRGLIDVVDRDFHSRSGRSLRVYGLRERGREAVAAISVGEDEAAS